MRLFKNRFSSLILRPLVLLVVLAYTFSLAQSQSEHKEKPAAKSTLTIENQQVRCSIKIDGTKLVSDRLEAQPGWVSSTGAAAPHIETDADFAIDLMWTDWDAPGQANNADNLITMTKRKLII